MLSHCTLQEVLQSFCNCLSYFTGDESAHVIHYQPLIYHMAKMPALDIHILQRHLAMLKMIIDKDIW